MKTLFTLAFSFFLLAVSAQVSVKQTDANKLFGRQGEIYFALPGSASMANELTKIISIDNVRGDTVFAYANRKQFARLQQGDDRSFLILNHPGMLIDLPVSSNPREILEWNYYPSYPAYEQILQDFAANHPDICSLHTIAVLPSGRKLLAARISDNVDVEEDEPEFLYTSSIHGDELTGFVNTLHLIDYLLSNYGQIPRITNLINNIDIWINPLANPDGTYAGGNNSVNGAQRYNANFVDLNRNYRDPEAGPHPDGEAWQPETIAFMNFAEERDFVMSANYHGGAEVINYPWDTWSRLNADDNWWEMVSREYADTCHAHSPIGYMTDLDNGVTNGYAWYTITGGRQDYMNYFQQCREVTMEISSTKLIPASQLLNHWNYNYRSMLNYLEQVTYGVRGIVTDTITGQPLVAQVFISNHDMDSSMVFSCLPIGNYHRLLKAGTYNLTFIAEGYLPKTIHNVVVTDKSSIRRDVKLWDGSAIPAFTASANSTHAGGSIQFTDISGGNPTSRLWTFEGGNIASSTAVAPVVTYNEPGDYDVKLYVANTIGGNELTEQDYITVSPDYYIGNLNPTTCYANFFDSQGPDAGYTAGENLISTFTSADADKVLKISFVNLNIENTSGCISDVLKIYDGPGIDSPLLASLCGNEIPEDIFTSVAGGSVTFSFESDAQNNLEGWNAIIRCDSGIGISDVTVNSLRIYPNPVSNNNFIIESEELMKQLDIFDFSGRKVYSEQINSREHRISGLNIKPGIYIISARTNKGFINGKLQVITE
jgi:PKD repeat protein